jgi:large subunit ribosomal protein L1
MAIARSKRYKASSKDLDIEKTYQLKEALALIKKMATPKFDPSVELHFNLNVDPKKSDQMVRGTVVLPHGTGKKIRVAVFCKGEHERIAKDSGADTVGGMELIERVSGGFLDFDCAIATPEMMKDLSKLGKVLGPRGLMPSPKTGTVTNDIAKAIEDVKKGKVEFRVDKQGGVHLAVGKVSFDEDKLCDNASRVIEALNDARPASVKGKFLKSLFISSTMNPGLRIAT